MSGNKIELGIHDISNKEYHASAGISKSGITQMLKSPAHYWARYIDPNRERFKETPAMKIGTATHKMILEPNTFFDEYEILTDVIAAMGGRKKERKAYIEEITARGKIAFHPDDLASINKMAGGVKNHPFAGGLVKGGEAEKSFYWIDDDTGALCKCRPDYWIPGMAIPDVKTTVDARVSEFSRSCANFGYHIQEAFYSDGVEAITGEQLAMPFIAIEKESPFAIGLYKLESEDVDLGRSEYKRALESHQECMLKDEWPAYAPEVRTISLPGWARKKGE